MKKLLLLGALGASAWAVAWWVTWIERYDHAYDVPKLERRS